MRTTIQNLLSIITACFLALISAPNGSAQLILNVVETGGWNEPTDTITAKWTGQSFTVSVANEPIPGAVIGNTYTVGTFGNWSPAFVDRNHRYTNATVAGAVPEVLIPPYLRGQEYIMSGNDNRDRATYTLDVTVSAAVRVYMLIDNRLGDPNSSNADPPSFGPTRMQWILDEGWTPVQNGLNRTANPSVPDEIGIDEGADNTHNQWYSIYSKDYPAGTFRLKQADNAGQNMYGVVVTPAPRPLAKFVNVGGNAIGSSSYDQGTGTFTIVGGGNDIWDQIDEFAYSYDNQVGDFDVRVRVESLTPNNRWSKAGIMVRESLAEDSRMVFLRVTPKGPTGAPADNPNGADDIKLAYRTGSPDVAGETGGQHEDPADQNPPPFPNAWLRLVRSGAVFTAYISTDGTAWTSITSQDTAASADWTSGGGPFRKDALVGLAVSRHSGGPTATAIFDDYSSVDAATFGLAQASSRGNPNAILVTFNKAPDAASLVPTAFDVVGITISSITSGPHHHSYWLNVDPTTPLVEGTEYTVTAFSVTGGGGTESPVPDSDTFRHGGGYENVGVHVGHNKEPVFGLGGHRARTFFARGLYSTAEGRPGLESNGLFEDPLPDTGTNERFTSTIFGILNVTTAGSYRFASSSDDIGELFLSTDANPANKVLIAREPVWNGSRQYAVVDRRAAQADLPQNGALCNQTPAITLAAGEYYLEYVFNEGGGGNNGSVTWAPAGETIANGRTPIEASSMAPSRYFNGSEWGVLFRNLGAVSITRQPASQTVIGGNPVTLSVGIDGTPAYRIQWRRNGQPIPGANGPTYTITAAVQADEGAYSVSVANEFSSATSESANLIVNIPLPPVVSGAAPDETFARVTVRFDKRVQVSSAQNAANYSISGGVTVNSATVDASGMAVVLATTTMAEGTTYTLTVRDVREITGNNPVSPNPTLVSFTTLVFSPGFAKKEYYQQWAGGAGSVDAFIVAQRAGATPITRDCYVNLWEQNTFDEYENYGGRIFGFMVAPVSGDYVFYFASDDFGRLFLSTDASAANVVEIAREPVWSGRRTWVGEAGGGGRGTPPVNISVPITLVGGQRYYMESYFTEGGGGDNMAVTVQGPGDPVPVNLTTLPVGGAYIGTFASPVGASASITQHPVDVTRAENTFATFTAAGTGASAGCGSVTAYQWYRNGVPIAGATSPTLMVGPVSIANDNGAMFRVRVSVVGAYADSAEAQLTVVAPQPLRVVRAEGVCNLTQVRVVYDQFVDPVTSQDVFNYTSDSFGISAAVLNSDNVSVTLTVDTPQIPGANYCVRISGVSSTSGLFVDPNPTTACFQACVVSCGFALQEIYQGPAGVTIADLLADPNYPANPSIRRYVGALSANNGDEFDNYGTRISGYIIPPVSGDYVFYLASDDGGDFSLSTDSSPANLQLIATEPVWAARRNYIGEADGGGRAGVTTHGGPQANISANINLVAGQQYYFEARMKEAGGGDNLDVAWKVPGGAEPVDGGAPISGVFLASLANPVGASLVVNQQPQDQHIVLTPGGGSVSTLLSQNFNAGDGGFTVQTPPAESFSTPWTYNAGTGSWEVNQDGAEVSHPMTSMLRTPPLTVTRDGLVQLTLSHRWSMEPGNWDGGQVRVSLNGGPFTTVSAAAFTSGGYNGAVLGNSASVVKGQSAFVLDSPGHQSPSFVESVANVGFFLAGDVVQIEFIYAGDTNTRGNFVPNWQIDSLTVREGLAGQQPARFSVAASAVVGGNPTSTIFYQWERDCGSGFLPIGGANSAVYTFDPRLSDNGCRYRVRMYVPGANAQSGEAVLTVVQPNTPPSFTCGPAPAPAICGGAVTVPNWATDIQVHSISRSPLTLATDFASAAGVTLGGVATVADGALKLTGLVGSQYGAGSATFPTRNFESLSVAWKSLIGGSGDGADGYSLNISDDIPADPGYGGEDGIGNGLRLTVDTFDNGGGEDGIGIVWRGNTVAFQQIPKNDPGTGIYLRKNAFVDATASVDAAGQATFTYDGQTITGALPGYAGISATRVLFWARTGGAFDNHWVDDFAFQGLPYDASSVENGQTVHFNVSNDNPGLFSAQPAVSANGTLTYTLAACASGEANVTVVAQDDGGTSDGGRDTSTPCTFKISVAPDTTAPSITCPANITVNSPNGVDCVVSYPAPAATDNCCVASVACAPASGSTFLVGTTTVTCTATDGAGNTASCTFTVTCIGTLPPVAVINSDQLIDLRPEFENPVLLSCNWWNACLVADGWTSSGAEPLTYLWFLEGDPTPIGAGPIITNCLEVGTHTIILVVTDRNGLTGEARKTIEVVTAPLAIDLLIEQINEAHKHGVLLDRKTKRELTATLRVALEHAGDNELRETQKALDAFEKKVRAQVADTYPVAAQSWIRWSQAVSSGMEKCIKPPRKPKDHHDDKKDADDKKDDEPR